MRQASEQFATKRHAVLAAAVAGLVWISAAHAETKTYIGVTGGDLSVAANWSPAAVPSTGAGTTAGDTLSWDAATNYSLTAGAALSGNNGVALETLAGQTGTLQIDGGTGTSAMRVTNVSLAAGSGAFTLGNGAGTFVINLGSGNAGFTGNTWTNNSANAAAISGDTQFASGGGVSGRVLTLAGTGDWTFNAAYGITVSGGTGTVGLTKNGAGTATFNATAVNFTAGTTLNAGTIRANATQALGTGAVFIAGNAGNTAKLELNGGISLNNAINQNGREATIGVAAPSIVNVAGNNTLSGTITLQTGGAYSAIESQAGTLTLSNATAVTTTATGARGLTFRGAGNFAVTGAISNGSATNLEIRKEDAGTLTLTGANAYLGQTTVAGGTLQIGNGGTTGSIAAGSNVVNDAALVFNRSNAVTQANAVSGTGTLTKLGAGTLTLSGPNTYTGATNVNAGTLAYATTASTIGSVTVATGAGLSVKAATADASLLSTTALTLGASTLTFDFSGLDTTSPLLSTGAFSANGAVAVSLLNTAGLTSGAHPLVGYTAYAGTATFPTNTFTIGARGTGTIANNGTNALVLNVLNDVPVWTGADNGTWAVGSTGVNGNWRLQTAGTATNFLQGDQILFNDAATGTTAVTIAAANVSPLTTTFDNSAKAYTVGGGFGIAGSGPLTKTGTGPLTLASTNTYTGATTVDRGTLTLTGSLGATPIAIAPDAGNTAVMNSSGTIAFGSTGRLRVGTVAGGLGVLNVSAGSVGGSGVVTVGDGGAGVATQTGGTVNANGGAALGVAAGDSGVLNVTAGNFNATTAAGTGLNVGQAGAGVLNVSGTGTVTLGGNASARGLNLGSDNVATAAGVVNLGAVGTGGGTIVTNVVQHSGAAGTGRFNFHGGTLRASTTADAGGVAGSGNSFMGGLTAVYVYGAGGTVDNNAQNITLDQDMVAPTGSGVTAIGVTNGGSGYVAAPLVTLTGGGGTGATAVANISNGQLVGFTITNPGTGYTGSPTVTLLGGTEGGAAATVGTITRTTNVSGGLTFAGSGTTVLAGTNTYTGANVVNAGTLVVTGGAAVADTAAVVVNGGATLSVASSETVGSLAGSGSVIIGGSGQTLTVGAANTSTAFAGNIFDATNGILTKTGSGTLTLSGYNSYAGVTNVSQGTLSVSSIANNTGTGTVINLGSGAGVGTLLYTGTGEMTNKSIVQSAGAAANGGTLDMSGTGTLQFTAPTLTANASQLHTLTLRGSTAGVGQIDGVISNGSAANRTSLTKDGTGTWVLAGANMYTGATTVAAGTLQLGAGGSAGALATGSAITTNGTLAFSRSNTVTQGVDFTAAAITGTGGIVQSGQGNLVLSAANTFSGGAAVNAGTVTVTTGSTPTAGVVTSGPLGRGTVTLAGGVLTNSVTLTIANPVTVTNAAEVATPVGTTFTLSGVVGGGGAFFTKTGAGTLLLSGTHAFAGTTTVAGGTLRATNAAYANLLANAGGIDLQTGRLLLDYAGGSSPAGQVKAVLDAGYATGFAAGQLRSSTLPAGQTIGYGDNGVGVVTVRLTLAGDADLDGDVDFNDFLALQTNFGNAGTRFDQGNFNYDALTDFNDFLALQTNFGQSVGGDSVAFSDEQVAAVTAFGVTHAVPEPAGVAAIGLGLAATLRRRRRA